MSLELAVNVRDRHGEVDDDPSGVDFTLLRRIGRGAPDSDERRARADAGLFENAHMVGILVP